MSKNPEATAAIARRFENRGRYVGQLRAIQIIDQNSAIINERTYRHGIDGYEATRDALRAQLKTIRDRWYSSGALQERGMPDPVLRIIDVPAPRR